MPNHEVLKGPLASAKIFGRTGLLVGSVSGFLQEGWGGALVGAFVAGVVVSVVGFLAGIMVWLTRRLCKGPFQRLVQRPDLWGLPLVCPTCMWHTTPDGPWRVEDCMSPPQHCPECRNRLRTVIHACPECGYIPRRWFRWPWSFRQALWGGYRCLRCDCEYDKWGRRVAA
jgi:hypothetical protein